MFKVFAYNHQGEKLKVFSSASLPECCVVAQSLYSSSDLEFKILDISDEVVVSYLKPVTE